MERLFLQNASLLWTLLLFFSSSANAWDPVAEASRVVKDAGLQIQKSDGVVNAGVVRQAAELSAHSKNGALSGSIASPLSPLVNASRNGGLYSSTLDTDPNVLRFYERVATFHQATADTGRTDESLRVWLGSPIKNGFKTVVALLDRRGGFRCTGTLISSQHILTATHCLCENGTTVHDIIAYAVVGSTIASGEPLEIDPSGSRWMGAGSICYRSLSDPDLALLQLLHPSAAGLAAPRLASDDDLEQLDTLRVVGFGRSEQAGSEGQKRGAVVPVVTTNCSGSTQATAGSESYSELYGCIRGSEIVAGRVGGPDTCQGDSGGPAFVAKIQSESDLFVASGDTVLAGVTSRAVANQADKPTNCGFGGVYVRLGGAARTWVIDEAGLVGYTTGPSRGAQNNAAAPSSILGCLPGTWPELAADPQAPKHTWTFSEVAAGDGASLLRVARDDGFVSGDFRAGPTANKLSGQLKWGNGETWSDVQLFPMAGGTEVRTNQSWSYRRAAATSEHALSLTAETQGASSQAHALVPKIFTCTIKTDPIVLTHSESHKARNNSGLDQYRAGRADKWKADLEAQGHKNVVVTILSYGPEGRDHGDYVYDLEFKATLDGSSKYGPDPSCTADEPPPASTSGVH